MSKNYAQGSIRIMRLRNGDTLMVALRSDKPLFQGVTDGGVSPDWSVAANQPTITPEAFSSYGNPVTITGFSWYYNGSSDPLQFGAAGTDGWADELTSTTSNPTAHRASACACRRRVPTSTERCASSIIWHRRPIRPTTCWSSAARWSRRA